MQLTIIFRDNFNTPSSTWKILNKKKTGDLNVVQYTICMHLIMHPKYMVGEEKDNAILSFKQFSSYLI